MVLKAITDNPDLTQNELATIVFKDKASVTRIIELLVKHKYLQRSAHAESRRRFKLSITAKGTKVIQDIMPTVLKNRKQALKNLSTKELQTAEKVLKSIANNCIG